MNENRLKEIEALVDAVTAGPWHSSTNRKNAIIDTADGWAICELFSCLPDDDNGEKHGDFIAASRTVIPELIAEVRRLREGVAKIEGMAAAWEGDEPGMTVSMMEDEARDLLEGKI